MRTLSMVSIFMVLLQTLPITNISALSRLRQSSSCSKLEEISTMGHLISLQTGRLAASPCLSLAVTMLQSMPSSPGLFSMSPRRQPPMGFLNRLTYSSPVWRMSTWLSWLSCRQSIFIWVKAANFKGTSARKLLDRSSLISPVHFEIVDSSACLMLVPAKISSFRDAGYFMNELMCSYQSVVAAFFFMLGNQLCECYIIYYSYSYSLPERRIKMKDQLKRMSSRSLCSSSCRCFSVPSSSTPMSFICWVSSSALWFFFMGQALGFSGARQTCLSYLDSSSSSSWIWISYTSFSATCQLNSSALPVVRGSRMSLLLKFLSTGWQLPLKTSPKQYFSLGRANFSTPLVQGNLSLQWLYLATTSKTTGGTSSFFSSTFGYYFFYSFCQGYEIGFTTTFSSSFLVWTGGTFSAASFFVLAGVFCFVMGTTGFLAVDLFTGATGAYLGFT